MAADFNLMQLTPGLLHELFLSWVHEHYKVESLTAISNPIVVPSFDSRSCTFHFYASCYKERSAGDDRVGADQNTFVVAHISVPVEQQNTGIWTTSIPWIQGFVFTTKTI
jgi:hypothetical protein